MLFRKNLLRVLLFRSAISTKGEILWNTIRQKEG